LNQYTEHYSVLKKECLFHLTNELDTNDEHLFVDGTFGAGGHSFALLEQCPNATVIAFDSDPDAIKNGIIQAKQRKVEARLQLIHSNFVNFSTKISSGRKISGVLLDLGISTHHLADTKRGITFRGDGPLDMRMNYEDDSLSTAADLVNNCEAERLVEILTNYGEERLAKRIVNNIVTARQKIPITTAAQLEEIVFCSYPAKQRHGRTHPATRTFQALRIAVNRELEVLENVLPDLFTQIIPGGKIAVISFHSLEDRIVKHTFKRIQKENPEGWKIITKRPITPSTEELKENSKSRSAKLRVIQRLQ